MALDLAALVAPAHTALVTQEVQRAVAAFLDRLAREGRAALEE